MATTTSTLDRPDVSLTMARFQSLGDDAMQCAHAISVFDDCQACPVGS